MPSPVDDEEEESQAHGGASVGSFVDGEGTMDIPQHVRVDAPSSPAHAARVASQEDAIDGQEEVEMAASMEEDGENESSGALAGMLFATDNSQEHDRFDIWLKVLETVVEEEEDENYIFYEDESDKDENAKESDGDHDDPYEVVPNNLQPLPLENNENYPQEDAKYFRRKNYVRKDKYSIATMVPDGLGITIPSLESIYNM